MLLCTNTAAENGPAKAESRPWNWYLSALTQSATLTVPPAFDGMCQALPDLD